MKQIRFRMTAFSDAAGKYNPEAVREGNEDNWYVDDNLGDEAARNWLSDREVGLSGCGMLMVVADGMGGMNAGEVASEIAIETVGDYFAPGRITSEVAATHASRRKYMEEVIAEADARIKKDAAHNSAHEGMGSTIIMAWLVGDELSVSWCGDSRAYRFNPRIGIEMLSEDHSYVQDLVRAGTLSYEDTFGHPQGNIITRSLGDPMKKAQPETRCFKVYNSDIILLCSDGLSGVLFDREARRQTGELISPENLEDIIRANRSSLQGCREALMDAAERNDWYDNVTVILCEILGGADEVPAQSAALLTGKTDGNDLSSEGFAPAISGWHCHRRRWMVVSFVLMLLGFAGGWWGGQCEGIRNIFGKVSVGDGGTETMSRQMKLIQWAESVMAQANVVELIDFYRELKDSIPVWEDSVWNARYGLFDAKYEVLRQITPDMLKNTKIEEFQVRVKKATKIDSGWNKELGYLIEEYKLPKQAESAKTVPSSKKKIKIEGEMSSLTSRDTSNKTKHAVLQEVSNRLDTIKSAGKEKTEENPIE